jgi:hypothetical protein
MFSVFALRLPRLLPTLPQLAAEEARKGGDQQKNARDHGVTVGKLEGSLGLVGGQLGLNRSRRSGSGGSLGSRSRISHRLLDSGVFALLGNPMLDEKHDGAVFREEGTLAFCADSFVVSPLFFPGGNIGDLAVNGTLNDLAMCGARPKYMSLSFIIEEGLQMEIFRKVLDSIGQSARAAGVWIVTGDTKVVEKGKGDGIFINTNVFKSKIRCF